MDTYREKNFQGERSLYARHGIRVENCVFENGESPLKECTDVEVRETMFKWKYPLWYCENVRTDRCSWTEDARAGVWYSRNVSVKDALIMAPKNFRRCTGLTLCGVTFPNAEETLWDCRDVKLRDVSASGHYFCMNCDGLEAENLTLNGNYSFDGAKNAVIRNSHLLTKDAFWNSENVTVENSFISGEYLGWNSKNLTLINCTVESNQGLCYAEGLVLRNCRLTGTTLAFEYSSVDAEIASSVEHVFNPKSGRIKADEIRELIIENDRVDPEDTVIECGNIGKISGRPEWYRQE